MYRQDFLWVSTKQSFLHCSKRLQKFYKSSEKREQKKLLFLGKITYPFNNVLKLKLKKPKQKKPMPPKQVKKTYVE